MTYLLPPLNALRAFEAAARHQSFKQAAHELHVTAGAISQQVRQLEERLGLQLFERRTRQLILTPPGETYLARIRQAFRCLADATAELRPDGVTGLLHIGVHARFAIEGLRTRLVRFREAQPRVGEQVLREQRRGVRAGAEEGRMAERDDARVAEDQVERQREQREDRDLVQQQRVAGQRKPGGDQRDDERDLPPAHARGSRQAGRRRAHLPPPARANSPCGRTSSTTIISV